ncbi:MAG TPA: DNA modification methylase [Anaerolineaceae bacterium]|nr:DNA modification methylase [Anaerolineaceae bacterium]
MKLTWHNEKRKIKDLVPYVANPRQITDKQAKDLKASLDKFGLAEPITINTDNTIIGGHQRKKILENLVGVDPDYEVDVWVPDRELSIDEMRELNVRLNKNVAGWDFDTLANNFELDDLLDWGFEKSDLDLDLWMPDPPEDAEPQIDRAEELREIWGVETGQLWQLGEHRLICGDCTDRAVVERLLGDDKPSLMVTDPPYGVEYESEKGVVTNDDRFDWSDAYNLFSGDVAYVWHGERTSLDVGINLRSCGFEIRSRIVWVKPSLTMGRGHYHFQHEGAWYAVKTGAVSHWCGDHKQSTVWNIDRENHQHPTVKPIECMERPIKNHESEFVYDPFLGSGTTLIACERLGRKCRAVEISPAYVAVAIQRWVDVTGGEPVMLTL